MQCYASSYAWGAGWWHWCFSSLVACSSSTSELQTFSVIGSVSYLCAKVTQCLSLANRTWRKSGMGMTHLSAEEPFSSLRSTDDPARDEFTKSHYSYRSLRDQMVKCHFSLRTGKAKDLLLAKGKSEKDVNTTDCKEEEGSVFNLFRQGAASGLSSLFNGGEITTCWWTKAETFILS